MPLGEVLRGDPPTASDADHDRAEVVDGKRDHPHRDAGVSLEEARRHKQQGTDAGGRGEAKKRPTAVGVVATDNRGEDEMEEANDEVGDPEEHCIVPECTGHR